MKYAEITALKPLEYACQEAMNTLATNLLYCGTDKNVLMLTSRYASEGKSFISMHLMRTLASLGKSVVLVDTDLRRSRIVSQYGIRLEKGGAGLAQYLAAFNEMDEVVYSTNIPNAYIVPIGREVANSLQLLSSPRMAPLMATLQQEFDIVLLDTPPVGVIVDSKELAKYCSGAVIVVSEGRGRKKEIREITEQIKNTGCPVLGAVLNNVEFGSFENRKYYYKSERYSSYYGDDGYQVRKKRKKKPE